MRHDGADKDGDENPRNDGETANCLDGWKRAVHVEIDEADNPGDHKVGDEDVPLFRLESVMHDRIHRCQLRGRDLGNRGHSKKPGKAVPPSCEPTAGASVSASGYCSPVIDCGIS